MTSLSVDNHTKGTRINLFLCVIRLDMAKSCILCYEGTIEGQSRSLIAVTFFHCRRPKLYCSVGFDNKV
jgi:hypothetical protein